MAEGANARVVTECDRVRDVVGWRWPSRAQPAATSAVLAGLRNVVADEDARGTAALAERKRRGGIEPGKPRFQARRPLRRSRDRLGHTSRSASATCFTDFRLLCRVRPPFTASTVVITLPRRKWWRITGSSITVARIGVGSARPVVSMTSRRKGGSVPASRRESDRDRGESRRGSCSRCSPIAAARRRRRSARRGDGRGRLRRIR